MSTPSAQVIKRVSVSPRKNMFMSTFHQIIKKGRYKGFFSFLSETILKTKQLTKKKRFQSLGEREKCVNEQ